MIVTTGSISLQAANAMYEQLYKAARNKVDVLPENVYIVAPSSTTQTGNNDSWMIECVLQSYANQCSDLLRMDYASLKMLASALFPSVPAQDVILVLFEDKNGFPVKRLLHRVQAEREYPRSEPDVWYMRLRSWFINKIGI